MPHAQCAKLSAPCRSAVNAIASPASSPAAPAAAAPPQPSDASAPAQGQSPPPAAAAQPSTKSSATAPTRKTTCWIARDDDAGRRIRNSQRVGVSTNRGADSSAAWADTANASAKSAYDPRAMPSRSAKIVCGSARRWRQNPFLSCRECAAIVAELLRGAGAGE